MSKVYIIINTPSPTLFTYKPSQNAILFKESFRYIIRYVIISDEGYIH